MAEKEEMVRGKLVAEKEEIVKRRVGGGKGGDW